ncbi:MAG: hypothetical protein ACFBZ8_04155 [Opitutales bacterium]
MLPARHSPFKSALLVFYLRRLFRRHFRRIWVSAEPGVETFLDNAESYPLVFFSNHQTWWDGFLELPIIEQFGIRSYLMMEEKNLVKRKFFTNAGVFGVDLESKSERARGLLYATRLLKETPSGERRALFLYPQGRLVSDFEPWPAFLGGTEILLKRSPAQAAVPVYKRILFGDHTLPEASLHIGQPVSRDAKPTTATFEEALKTTGKQHAAFLADPEWRGRSRLWR